MNTQRSSPEWALFAQGYEPTRGVKSIKPQENKERLSLTHRDKSLSHECNDVNRSGDYQLITIYAYRPFTNGHQSETIYVW